LAKAAQREPTSPSEMKEAQARNYQATLDAITWGMFAGITLILSPVVGHSE